jgi:L-iditol 2-dehydrogenase
VRAFALYGKEDMRPVEMEVQPLGEQGLLLKVLACGVCGSDARMYFRGPTSRYDLPIVLGHEFTGEVVDRGQEVQGYEIGDWVTVAPLVPCMRCAACSHGQDNLCQEAELFGVHLPGGFAELLHVPGQMVEVGGVVKVPMGTGHRAAALTEILACCLHGLRQVGGVEAGSQILILGDGPVGLTFLQLAKLMGAGRLVTAGRRPRRRELAAELGADEALDETRVEIPTYAREHDLAPDLVIVAASSLEATADALAVVRPGGTVLLFAGYLPGSTFPLAVNDVHYRELHIHGSIDCTIRDFRNAAGLLPQLQMDRLITASLPLAETVEAFHASREREAVKILVEP